MFDFVQLQEIARERLERDRAIQSVEAVGPTLEAAVSDAAALLDAPVRRIEYEVLERGSSGFWGMGKKDWRIQAYEKTSARKKKHAEILFVNDDEDEVAVIEDRDGEVFVVLRQGGDAMLKVTPPSGKGKNASEDYAIQLLSERNVDNINMELVSDTVIEASGQYVKVGDFVQYSYNDSVVRVEIADNEMSAYITVSKPGEGGCDIPYETFYNTLKQQYMVVHGIKEEFLRRFADQPLHGEKVEVAEASKPIDGRNAYIQYNFNVDQDRARLREGRNGKIDHKDINMIQNVAANQPLAKKVPPEKGVVGKTVTGKELPARDGVDISLPVGENVRVGEDGATIIANISGRVVMNNNLISVEPVYLVEGNVNLKTGGNIDFSGSVVVKGNVDDGFSVKAAGNIEVTGTVAKANLEAGGDIVIRQGINAKGEGLVRAGKSVWARFIQNANIQAGDMVMATDGIINSYVDALNRIICQGKRAAIMGGRLRACEEINAKVLGNPTTGTETICEVGYDPKAKEELDKLMGEKEIMVKQLEELKRNIQTLVNIKQQRKSLPEDKEAYLQELTEKRDIQLTDLKKTEGQIQKIQGYLNSLKARGKISASTMVYPGVKMVIRDVRDEVKAERKAVTCILENGLINYGKYEEPDENAKKGPDGYTTN